MRELFRQFECVPGGNFRSFAVFFAAVLGIVQLVGAPSAGSAADHVIHISIDGLKPNDLQTLIDAGSAPNLKRFQEEGAWTNNARTDYTHTITLPNHTSMLTGRPVSLPEGMPSTVHHGYTSNGQPSSSWTLHNRGPDVYKASTFDVVHDAGLSTALYASKSKFVIFDQSYNSTTGGVHANGRDKIDSFFAQENASAAMQTQLLAGLANNLFNYTFVHYADPDIAGHTFGWGSANYMDSIVTVDGYLGGLFDLIENNELLNGHTAIVLSSDHGGSGTSHSNAALAQHYTIPFYTWGAGVAAGDLYSFNSESRTSPGTGRPDYNALGQPIRNGDGGNLAVALLGLGPIPNSLINASQNLRVAGQGDFNLDGVVDAADYVVWRNNDGMIAGYNTWREQFGVDFTGHSAASAAPEPGTSALLLVSAAILRFVRSRRSTRAQKKPRGGYHAPVR
jgi:Type I phosphodiesterase / nucleotide pyrophosphatase